MREAASDAPVPNPVLHYMAIVSAARDFGLSLPDLERVVRRFDPLDFRPTELADALADALPGAAQLTGLFSGGQPAAGERGQQ